MIWDATFGRSFGRRRIKKFYDGQEVVLQGRLVRPDGELDDRHFLCLSLSEGIAVAGDRLGAYRRELVAWAGETVEVKLRELELKGVPRAWVALRLTDHDGRNLVCEYANVALVRAASARHRVAWRRFCRRDGIGSERHFPTSTEGTASSLYRSLSPYSLFRSSKWCPNTWRCSRSSTRTRLTFLSCDSIKTCSHRPPGIVKAKDTVPALKSCPSQSSRGMASK